MIMQLILMISFAGLFVYSRMQGKYSTIVSGLLQILALIGLVLAMIPELSIWIANFLGVSRGVDVALYLYVPLSLLLMMHINAKLRRENVSTTTLVRELALLRHKLDNLQK